jgi:hypothetical protein
MTDYLTVIEALAIHEDLIHYPFQWVLPNCRFSVKIDPVKVTQASPWTKRFVDATRGDFMSPMAPI